MSKEGMEGKGRERGVDSIRDKVGVEEKESLIDESSHSFAPSKIKILADWVGA